MVTQKIHAGAKRMNAKQRKEFSDYMAAMHDDLIVSLARCGDFQICRLARQELASRCLDEYGNEHAENEEDALVPA